MRPRPAKPDVEHDTATLRQYWPPFTGVVAAPALMCGCIAVVYATKSVLGLSRDATGWLDIGLFGCVLIFAMTSRLFQRQREASAFRTYWLFGGLIAGRWGETTLVGDVVRLLWVSAFFFMYWRLAERVSISKHGVSTAWSKRPMTWSDVSEVERDLFGGFVLRSVMRPTVAVAGGIAKNPQFASALLDWLPAEARFDALRQLMGDYAMRPQRSADAADS